MSRPAQLVEQRRRIVWMELDDDASVVLIAQRPDGGLDFESLPEAVLRTRAGNMARVASRSATS